MTRNDDDVTVVARWVNDGSWPCFSPERTIDPRQYHTPTLLYSNIYRTLTPMMVVGGEGGVLRPIYEDYEEPVRLESRLVDG